MASGYRATGMFLRPNHLYKQISASLKNKEVLVGTVMPRFNNVMAKPFNPGDVEAHKRPTPQDAIMVRIPTLEFDERLKRFYRHETDLLAFDPESTAKSGDTVVLTKMQKAEAKDIIFELKRVVFKCGDVVDPISGEPVRADKYRSDLTHKKEKIGRREDAVSQAYEYEKAPARGRLEGSRDFSDKATYYRWNNFKPKDKDDYSLVA